jgi:titin
MSDLLEGHRFRPAYDFDYVALDLLSVYPEDSGVYTCHARNAYGEAVSSATIKIFGESAVRLKSPPFPPPSPPTLPSKLQ